MLPLKVEEKLRQLCETSALQFRHSAVILRGTKVVAWGVNRNKTHTLQGKYCKNPNAIYLHAEIDVLVKAINLVGPKGLIGATIAVCRTLKDGSFANSCPCEGCRRAIDAFQLNCV